MSKYLYVFIVIFITLNLCVAVKCVNNLILLIFNNQNEYNHITIKIFKKYFYKFIIVSIVLTVFICLIIPFIIHVYVYLDNLLLTL